MDFRNMSESSVSKVGRLAKLRKFRRRTIDSAQIRLGRKEKSNHLESLEEENLARLYENISENITQSIPGRRRSQKRCIEDDDDGKAKSNKVSFKVESEFFLISGVWQKLKFSADLYGHTNLLLNCSTALIWSTRRK